MRAATALRAWYEMAANPHRLRGGNGTEDDGGWEADAAAVLSGEYQAQEMSTMVSALARVVSGGDGRWDGGWNHDPAAMGGYSGAPTPDYQLAAAGEDRLFCSLFIFGGECFAFAGRCLDNAFHLFLCF
jgi:hypothetical protein